MTEYVIDPKKPLPRPEWVEKTNSEGRMWAAAGMLSHVVPLDEASILASAYQMTGLNDMGEDDWQEPLRIMLRSFEEEADLNLIGRLCSRSELLIWITSRLRIVDLVKRHPEIRDEPIEKPIFVTGLPRTGTSILQELLGQDPNMRTPLFWECYFPGEAAESGGKDAAARASGDALVNQWARVVPEIRTMHETGGDIPAFTFPEGGVWFAACTYGPLIVGANGAPEREISGTEPPGTADLRADGGPWQMLRLCTQRIRRRPV